jgi:hypothetical protein
MTPAPAHCYLIDEKKITTKTPRHKEFKPERVRSFLGDLVS